MNITRKNVVEMVGVIKATYPYTYKDIDSDTMKLLVETWFASLCKYDKKVVDVAFKKAIESCKMPPTLADIIEHITDISALNEPTDTELWEQLVKIVDEVEDCVYHFNFGLIEANGKTQGENAKDRFNAIWDNMPQVLKDYCGNKSGLISLTEIDLSYEKGRFLRIIPTLKHRDVVRSTTNPEILKLVSDIAKSFDDGGLLSYEDKKN